MKENLAPEEVVNESGKYTTTNDADGPLLWIPRAEWWRRRKTRPRSLEWREQTIKIYIWRSRTSLPLPFDRVLSGRMHGVGT